MTLLARLLCIIFLSGLSGTALAQARGSISTPFSGMVIRDTASHETGVRSGTDQLRVAIGGVEAPPSSNTGTGGFRLQLRGGRADTSRPGYHMSRTRGPVTLFLSTDLTADNFGQFRWEIDPAGLDALVRGEQRTVSFTFDLYETSPGGFPVRSLDTASISFDLHGENDPIITSISSRSATVTEGERAFFDVTVVRVDTSVDLGGIPSISVILEFGGSGFIRRELFNVLVSVPGLGTHRGHIARRIGHDQDGIDGILWAVIRPATSGHPPYEIGGRGIASMSVLDDDIVVSIEPWFNPFTNVLRDNILERYDANFTLFADRAPNEDRTILLSVEEEGNFFDGAPPTSVTLPAGARSVTFRVLTVDDDIDEADGRITATIQDGDGYTAATAPSNKASITMRDDDVSGVTLSQGVVTVDEDGMAVLKPNARH